jgi:hypothetical protein
VEYLIEMKEKMVAPERNSNGNPIGLIEGSIRI